jgi:hypothetical protein
MKARALAIAVVAAVTAGARAARAQVTPGAPVEESPPYEEPPPPEQAEPPPPEEPPPPPPAAPAPAPEPAAAPPQLGAEGQLVVSVDLPFMNQGPQFAIVHESTSMGGPSSNRIVIQPSVDYFVARTISIGAQLGIDRVTVKGNNNFFPGEGLNINGTNGGTTVLVEARAGVDLPISDTVSLWARLGLGYTYTSTRYVYSPNVTGHSIPLSLTVPFVWHPGAHFFLGVGPALLTQLQNNAGGQDMPKATDYGITALIGGTIGGR